MTDKELVLSRYPDAVVDDYCGDNYDDDAVFIYKDSTKSSGTIGFGSTEKEAWKDGAACLLMS